MTTSEIIKEKEEILSALADMVYLMNRLHPAKSNEFKSIQRIKAEKVLAKYSAVKE